MSSQICKSKTEKIILASLFLAALGLQLKYIFVEFDADTAYAISTSYRLAQGDRLFLDMWEPHQTSSFLLAGLMKLYLAIKGDNTGIVLFANIAGVLIHFGVVAAVWQVFKEKLDSLALAIMCLFLLIIRPKGYVLPEFSNMVLWFSILLFLCLIQYFEDNRRKHWLILSSVFLCLQIISYPSCLIVYFCVCVALYMYANERRRDILLFSLCCFVQGCAYVLFFVLRMGISDFLYGISKIISGDSAHSSFALTWSFFSSLGEASAWLAVCLTLAVLLTFLRSIIVPTYTKRRLFDCCVTFSLLVLITGAMNMLFLRNRHPRTWIWFTAFYLCILAMAVYGLKSCTEYEKRSVLTGYLLSFGTLLSVAILTNLDFLCSLNYTILAVMLSLLPLFHLLEKTISSGIRFKRQGLLLLFCLTLVINNGASVLDTGGIVKSGPALGIIAPYVDAYKINISMEDWQDNVKPGDHILLVGPWGFNTIGYLYGDTAISMYSVMCDPTYDETLLEYWKKHPEKYPDVVAVEAWYGELCQGEEEWIMQWLQGEYQPSTYTDTDFWRFYRLEE